MSLSSELRALGPQSFFLKGQPCRAKLAIRFVIGGREEHVLQFIDNVLLYSATTGATCAFVPPVDVYVRCQHTAVRAI